MNMKLNCIEQHDFECSGRVHENQGYLNKKKQRSTGLLAYFLPNCLDYVIRIIDRRIDKVGVFFLCY